MSSCQSVAVVYTLPNCPQCVEAKRLLECNQVCIEEKRIGVDVTVQELINLIGHPVRSAPQIRVDGTWIDNGVQGLRSLYRTCL